MVELNFMLKKAREVDSQAENLKEVAVYMDVLFETFRGEVRSSILDEYEKIYIQIRPSLRSAIELLDEISNKIREEERIMEEIDKKIANQYRE